MGQKHVPLAAEMVSRTEELAVSIDALAVTLTDFASNVDTTTQNLTVSMANLTATVNSLVTAVNELNTSAAIPLWTLDVYRAGKQVGVLEQPCLPNAGDKVTVHGQSYTVQSVTHINSTLMEADVIVT